MPLPILSRRRFLAAGLGLAGLAAAPPPRFPPRLWSLDLASASYGGGAAADRHGRVVVLDPATRKPKWTARIPGHVQSEPVLIDLDGDGTLDVVVTNWRGDQSIYALHGKTGKPMWTHPMKGDMYHGVSAF